LIKLYTLKEASNFTGISESVLRKKLNQSEIAGEYQLKGNRNIWVLTESVVHQLASDRGRLPYNELLEQWKTEQQAGIHYKKPLSSHTIQANLRGLELYWESTHLEPNIANLYPEGLAQTFIVIQEDGLCHYSKRKCVYDGITSFYKFLIRKNLKVQSELDEIRALLPKRKTPPERTVLTETKLEALLEFNENHDWGKLSYDKKLNRMLIFLMANAGLRLEEAITVKISNINWDEHLLTVLGKGQKIRMVGLQDELYAELQKWINEIRPQTKVYDFILLNNVGSPLKTSSAYHRIYRLAKQSKIAISPHGLRRTFATLNHHKGVQVEALRISLGHEDLKTTEGYILTTEREAASQLIEAERRLKKNSIEEQVANYEKQEPSVNKVPVVQEHPISALLRMLEDDDL